MSLCEIGLVAVLGCLSWSCAGQATAKDLGPQTFAERSIESVGATDSDVASAVEAAVVAAQHNDFRYDASGSKAGRVVVTALWKGSPVTLTLRFFKEKEALIVASKTEQSGDAFLANAGVLIEGLYFEQLASETQRRGLELLADPNAVP